MSMPMIGSTTSILWIQWTCTILLEQEGHLLTQHCTLVGEIKGCLCSGAAFVLKASWLCFSSVQVLICPYCACGFRFGVFPNISSRAVSARSCTVCLSSSCVEFVSNLRWLSFECVWESCRVDSALFASQNVEQKGCNAYWSFMCSWSVDLPLILFREQNYEGHAYSFLTNLATDYSNISLAIFYDALHFS